nr:MAG: ORF1 [Torque teno midi virus]
MPFWWGRRNRFWRGKRRAFYKRRKSTWRRRRKRFYTNKRRRAPRRRRRRRKKVRRKLKKLPIKQWQPAYITKCKIRGLQLYLLGAQGKQWACYTDEKHSWTPPKAPGGGGFSYEQYTLQYLYTEYLDGNNYWTKSNSTKDLVRYTGGYFKLYRHQKTDFVIHYIRNPKKDIGKMSYSEIHPKELLLKRHSKILFSKLSKPFGKRYLKIKFKPPRNMQTNWYFMSEFAEKPLINLAIAACDLNYSYISCCDTNQLLSMYTLNTDFFQHPNWGKATQTAYEPYSTIAKTLEVTYENGSKKVFNMSSLNYKDSISWEKGWFQTGILKAFSITQMNNIPIGAARYNPTLDDGSSNAVYLTTILKDRWERPTTDKTIILEGKPLWQLLYGFINFVQKAKPHEEVLKNYLLIICSPAIYPFKSTKQFHVPIDSTFINGKGPYEEYVDTKMKELWFPTLQHQQQTINNIVLCGPYIPKYQRDRESTWELHGDYCFFFKWGGDDIQNQEVYEPAKQGTFTMPGNITEAIQISDPSKQIPASLLHAWDIRRGLITPTALKRIQQNLPFDETLSTATEQPPLKKKKKNNNIPYQDQETQEIQTCLQELCEESTFQEPQTQEQLLKLIQEQQHQQQLIKFNLLHLISDLKNQQKKIQLHTGLLN